VIQPGEVKTYQGEGMPKKDDPMERGNLHVKFVVEFPSHLNDKAKQVFNSIL
jgi:DnaJ-class molecular chaperone